MVYFSHKYFVSIKGGSFLPLLNFRSISFNLVLVVGTGRKGGPVVLNGRVSGRFLLQSKKKTIKTKFLKVFFRI